MTTSLYSFTLLTAGADKMASSDPHGWTLTLISVIVVFTALIILYGIYGLLGEIFMGRFKIKQKTVKSSVGKSEPDDSEVAAAIAMALEMYTLENLHDEEPGIITIEPRDNTNWKFGKR